MATQVFFATAFETKVTALVTNNTLGVTGITFGEKKITLGETKISPRVFSVSLPDYPDSGRDPDGDFHQNRCRRCWVTG